jgi:hypothetical protein
MISRDRQGMVMSGGDEGASDQMIGLSEQPPGSRESSIKAGTRQGVASGLEHVIRPHMVEYADMATASMYWTATGADISLRSPITSECPRLIKIIQVLSFRSDNKYNSTKNISFYS